MSTHPVQWQAPQPLWARFGTTSAQAATAADQSRPAILRFAGDDFMDQIIGTLARDPARLGRMIARPETWRSPMADPPDLVQHTPLPRLVNGAVRATSARAVKPGIEATAFQVTRTEQAQQRVLPLKLYQPAHQRFYLVGASLVCGLPGMPDRSVVAGGAEQINFVMRRMLRETPGVSTSPLREFAYIKDATGVRWQRVDAGAEASRFVPGEELLPVFPLTFQDDNAHCRMLWTGLVPVGRREEYIGATVSRTVAAPLAAGQQAALGVVEPSAPASKTARLTQFLMEVAEPWKTLIRASFTVASTISEDAAKPPISQLQRVFQFNLQQQQASWLILLDFADYLTEHLSDVWDAIQSGTGAASLPPLRKQLYDWLGTATMPAGLTTMLLIPGTNTAIRTPAGSLRDALKKVRAAGVRERLAGTELTYNGASYSSSTEWPPFHFVLAGVVLSTVTNTVSADGPYAALSSLGTASATDVEADPLLSSNQLQHDAQEKAQLVDRLAALVGQCLTATAETNAPPVPFALQVKNAVAATVSEEARFVVRFVYMRTDCGPLHPPQLSAPTQWFQLANFFDADAPARPIRITLPMDTSPAGLRKFNKNTAFVLSDMLCGQVQRAKGLGLIDLIRAVLPFPLHKDLDVGSGGSCNNGSVNIGMICSLSIPIITICALILLIIFVSLLDLVFHWLPFFIFCFPVPKLTGKQSSP